ncbi:MAG: hypothetical protein HKO95_09430 [Rhodobacteraceae bacterium]|nr:hypothetical protein [Alphaproteobacteria bacterium]MBT8474810.1 hypothetical protein [Alphaproteobacteria bacterium]NNK66946.1 hypothetical protein [Paracoccaceae bacterium]
MAQTDSTVDEIEFTPEGIDTRLTFHPEKEVFEVDLSHVHFHNSADVNAFYDRAEDRIAQSGEDLWFFLVNYQGCRIDPAAWIAFSRRGKTLNLAHSMASVRYDASPETRRQIERDAGTEAFDPNLFTDRDAAIARLATMPSKRRAKIVHTPNYTRADFVERIEFLMEDRIMEVDFSDFTFHHARDVDDFYDYIEELIRKTDRKWYFLVNYNGCRINPEAWVQYARRGRNLNIAASLGSVRYAAGSETEADIRMRAESQGFRPNIRNTREEALARIAEIKAETARS